MPPITSRIPDLQPQSSGAVVLTPDTKVVVLNRGREPLEDMFNSEHFTIPVGLFTVAYAAALHFKARAVVPGSRNPETNFQASFLAILGPYAIGQDGGIEIARWVDRPEDCTPFTEDECAQYGLAVEALDREAMVDPIERDVVVTGVAGGGNTGVIPASRVKSAGGTSAGGKKKPQQERSAAALAKPARNEALEQMQQDAAGGV